jgi:hypothetical protein
MGWTGKAYAWRFGYASDATSFPSRLGPADSRAKRAPRRNALARNRRGKPSGDNRLAAHGNEGTGLTHQGSGCKPVVCRGGNGRNRTCRSGLTRRADPAALCLNERFLECRSDVGFSVSTSTGTSQAGGGTTDTACPQVPLRITQPFLMSTSWRKNLSNFALPPPAAVNPHAASP